MYSERDAQTSGEVEGNDPDLITASFNYPSRYFSTTPSWPEIQSDRSGRWPLVSAKRLIRSVPVSKWSVSVSYSPLHEVRLAAKRGEEVLRLTITTARTGEVLSCQGMMNQLRLGPAEAREIFACAEDEVRKDHCARLRTCGGFLDTLQNRTGDNWKITGEGDFELDVEWKTRIRIYRERDQQSGETRYSATLFYRNICPDLSGGVLEREFTCRREDKEVERVYKSVTRKLAWKLPFVRLFGALMPRGIGRLRVGSSENEPETEGFIPGQ